MGERSSTVQQVLFDPGRFHFNVNGLAIQQATFTKFVGWGLLTPNPNPNGLLAQQLALEMGGDDGMHWDSPRRAYLRDTGRGNCSSQSSSCDVPFLVSPGTTFAIYYDPTTITSGNVRTQYPFTIYYVPVLAPCLVSSSSQCPASAAAIGDVHRAVSYEGVTWLNDASITATGGQPPLLGGAGAFNQTTTGPTQLVFQLSTSGTCAAASPWSCRFVMLYDATGPTGNTDGTRVGLAWSSTGTDWAGITTPLLDLGAAGAFDDKATAQAHVKRDGRSLTLYYSGGRSASGPYSIGVATADTEASGGLTFTRRREAAARELFPSYIGTTNDSLTLPTPVPDGTHTRVYFSVAYDQTPENQTLWMARSTPAAGAGPSISFASPVEPQRFSQPKVEAFLTDTNGTASLIGVDLRTIKLVLDPAGADTATPPTTGTPSLGGALSSSIVGSLGQRSNELSVPNLTAAGTSLTDGMHTLVLAAQDLEGNWGRASTTFLVDTSPPTTALTTFPSSPVVGFPTSIGRIEGESVDGTSSTTGTPITRIRIIVTNPIGQTEQFLSSDKIGIHYTVVNQKDWLWSWYAPVADPIFAIPGMYTIATSGIDSVGNTERPVFCGSDATACNTLQLLIV